MRDCRGKLGRCSDLPGLISGSNLSLVLRGVRDSFCGMKVSPAAVFHKPAVSAGSYSEAAIVATVTLNASERLARGSQQTLVGALIAATVAGYATVAVSGTPGPL